MPKKSMIAKARRTPKFSSRKYNRCQRCGSREAIIASLVSVVSVSENSLCGVKFPALLSWLVGR